MSHDMQMARGAAEGETNLAVGEPYFFQQIVLPTIGVRSISKPLTYPVIGGEPELLEELHRLVPQYQYITVVNGAKQGIAAAFHAFAETEGKVNVHHQPPYWPSYPTLAREVGLTFNGPVRSRDESILVVTSPNNPDGRQEYLFKSLPEVWDAAYAQPLYGYHGVAPPHRVGVFSAAKMFGLSGLRIGWVGTNERALHDAMAYFTEISTSGVSIPSQMHLAGVIRALREPEQMGRVGNATFEARAALMTNGNTFTEVLGDLVQNVKGVPTDGSGMFAWFQARWQDRFTHALKAAKVKVVTGEACGEKTPGYFRMSMGQMPEITRDALLRVRQEYLR